MEVSWDGDGALSFVHECPGCVPRLSWDGHALRALYGKGWMRLWMVPKTTWEPSLRSRCDRLPILHGCCVRMESFFWIMTVL